MSCLVEHVTQPDHSGGFAGKFRASVGVLPVNRRVIGFSSVLPFCKLCRVSKKSAVLSAAVAVNRARFSPSQNLWRGTFGKGAERAAKAIGEASGGGASREASMVTG